MKLKETRTIPEIKHIFFQLSVFLILSLMIWNINQESHEKEFLNSTNEIKELYRESTYPDYDGDGITNENEVEIYHTDPFNADSDYDGLDDGREILTYHTDPLDYDSDDDGLNDGKEIDTYHTDPLSIDTDEDGLNDFEEVDIYETDPSIADSDNDGLKDGQEVSAGINPNSYFMPTGLGISIISIMLLIISGIILKKRKNKLKIKKKNQITSNKNEKIKPEIRSEEIRTKLKKIMKMSKSLPISRLAIMLDLEENTLWNNLVDWSSEFEYSIVDQNIIFGSESLDGFLDTLDASFEDWNQKEISKEGKSE